MRLVVLGTPGRFTAAVLEGLAAGGVIASAAVLRRRVAPVAPASLREPSAGGAGDRRSLPVAVADPAAAAADRLGARVVGLPAGAGDRTLARILRDLAPELVLLACYPRRLPASAAAIASRDCWNVHPSALPAYRGPVPVFWQLRDGLALMGVTVHRVTGTIDAGPVLARRLEPVAPGETEAAISARLAARGGRLAAALALAGAREGTPQPARDATAHGPPRAPEDFSFPATWTAERAYRFVAGTAARGVPYTVLTAEGPVSVERALGYDPAARPARPVERRGRELVLALGAGALRALAPRAPAISRRTRPG